MSKQQKGEDYIVKVNLELPKDHVCEAEIRLVAACLGELLKRVLRDTGTDRE